MTAPRWQHPRANRLLRLRTTAAGTAVHEQLVEVAFELQRSARRRTIGLQISPEGLRVLAPQHVSVTAIDTLLQRKARWVLDKLHTMQTRPPHPAPLTPAKPATPAEAAAHREQLNQAHALFTQRLNHFAPLLGVRYTQLRLSNARTRWGSANSRGHIALNWQLIHLPPELIDYVVVHELSHLRHMNHSPAFWAVVASILPDHVQRRQALKQVRLTSPVEPYAALQD
ncbi:MAG: hypothetical protein RLZZ352_1128 [Pseudomonadota bacterium]|jgi:predicted metal-dependent hydrolase